MKPVTSIIIVNYRSEDALEHCLRSIHIATAKQTEIILIDNSPGGGAEHMLLTSGLAGTYFPQRSNIGYTLAANIGATHATGQYLCFLNPDTVWTKNSLDILLDWLAQHPQTVVGPRELNGDGQIVTSAFPFVTRRHIWGAHVLYKLPWPMSWHRWLSWLIPAWRYDRQSRTALRPLAVEVLSGSCLVMSQDVWQQVGPWNEELVYFGLESEWFRRARQAGIVSWYLPDATIFHEHGLSIGRGDGGQVRQMADRNRQWHARRLGWWTIGILMLLIWIERAIRPPKHP